MNTQIKINSYNKSGRSRNNVKLMDEDKQPQDAENLDETSEEEDQASSEDEKDLSAEVAKYKAIAERKSKQLEKIQSSLQEKEEEPKKPNTEQSMPTMEDMALMQQGYTLEELEVITKAAQIDGVSKTEAAKSAWVDAKINAMRDEAKLKSNSLPASAGSRPAPREKTPGNMTDEEHEAWAKEKLQNAING